MKPFYATVFFFFLLLNGAPINAQVLANDSAKQTSVGTKSDTAVKIQQIRIGFDISRILFNNLFPSRKGYEIQADYNWRKNLYLAAEAGWGKGKINYSFLQYQTQGGFVRIGIEQSLLGVMNDKDFDNAFIGIRYGMGFGKMSDAKFTVPSPFGGQSEGSAPGQNYLVHWGELVGGIKVSIWKNLYAGWAVRGKFLFNPKTFKTIAPNYIPGYGKGDKNTVFDFNFYLSYGIQWR